MSLKENQSRHTQRYFLVFEKKGVLNDGKGSFSRTCFFIICSISRRFFSASYVDASCCMPQRRHAAKTIR